MNGRKKLLCVFLLAFFLFCYTSVNAFADPASSEASSEASSSALSSEDVHSALPTQGKVSSLPPPSSSSAPSKPSSPSSRRHRRTVSSAVSSMPDSTAFSELFSSSPETSGEISLPAVGSVSEVDPLASAASTSSGLNKPGVIAWVCIGLGVLVVLIVILSNRRPPRGPGRSRYHRSKRSSRKHLLNDKYYQGLNRY